MNMPGFSADLSFYRTPDRFNAARRTGSRRGRVAPALPFGGDGNPLQQCLADCFEGCTGPVKVCQTKCRSECLSGGAGGTGGGGTGGGGTGGGGCPPLLPSGSGLPIYGNYCGPGYGDPTGMTPPVDAVDAACRAHDLCYGTSGYFDCACDRTLITSMPAAIAATPCATGKIAGQAIIAFFAGFPCVCHYTSCLPPFLGGGCVTLINPIPGIGGIGPC